MAADAAVIGRGWSGSTAPPPMAVAEGLPAAALVQVTTLVLDRQEGLSGRQRKQGLAPGAVGQQRPAREKGRFILV